MRTIRTILALLLALCSLSAAAQELTVTSLKSNANNGIVLTFSQDVKVTHSVFGTKCYEKLTDKDGTPSALNANPRTEGNVVTLTAAFCTFVNGHNIHLELNPECFTTLDGTTHLTGTTTFDFVMGDGAAADPITAVQIAPSNGTLKNLGNIAVVFAPSITVINDPAGITVTNEKGHSLPILSVTIDTETPIHALNVNIDSQRATLQGGTTYSLHIAPGALTCGTITNEEELVYGKWYIKPEPLSLVTDPPHQRMVESISEITVKAENGQSMTCTDLNRKDLHITGIMEDQNIVLATVKQILSDRTSSTFRLILDRPINSALLRESGSIYDFAKMSFPEGMFTQGSAVNDAFQTVWKIGVAKPLGDFAWNFSPREDSNLESLGSPISVEGIDGENTEIYAISFGITGRDAYLTITDAQNIKIVNEYTGETVKAFARGDLKQDNINSFKLIMDSPITENGSLSLVIPADCINLYSDAEHYSAPQHPSSDIKATWTIGSTLTGIVFTTEKQDDSPIFDITGRRVRSERSSVIIKEGRKILK